VSIRTVPGDPAPDTLSIPKEPWYPTPPNVLAAAPTPHLSMLTRLPALIALLGGYTAALSSTAHHAALAPALLLVAFVTLVRFGHALVRYAVSAVRHRRSETDQ
jgi:hypothetical protein